MELELGLKITKTRDDITSISEFRLAKDTAGLVFQSRETNTMFILTAHLKGYKRNNIDIKISEDGSKISISGEKPIQEMMMMGWVMFKKEVEITRFNKGFKIPDGVILDRIKAKYDEEEWILKIVMPKLVKGICGARIEEVKEEESDRGRSELEKSEADHILNGIGETSQEGSKESEVQEMEDGESVMGKKEGGVSDKMFDDANGDIIGETIKKEIEEFKLGIKDGDGESVRQKVGNAGLEAMKTSELDQTVSADIPQNIGDTSQDKDSEVQEMEDSESVVEKKEGGVSDKMFDDANGDIIGETIKKEIEESKLGIKDGDGESVRQKVGNAVLEAMKTSERDQTVSADIPQNIGDTSQDKDSEVQEMEDSESVVEKKEGGVSDKMFDDANGDIIGETIKKEIEASKLGIKDGDGESVRQKFGNAGLEAMKTSELDQTVSADIPQNIGDTSQDKDSEVQEMGDSESVVEKKEGGVSDKVFDDANEDIIGETVKKEIEESKLGIKDGNGESVRQKVGNAGLEAMKTSELDQTVSADITQNIGDTSQDKDSEVQEMEDSESVVEKKEGGVSDKMFDDANGDIIGETIKKEIEESKLGIKDGNGESVREKVSKAGYEATKTSELDQNVSAGILQNIGDRSQDKEFEVQEMEDSESVVEKKEGGVSDKMFNDANGDIIGETIKKEIEESKLGIKDGKGESVREKIGEVGFEAKKTSELKQNVGAWIPQNIGDTSQKVSKESVIQQMGEAQNAVEKLERGKYRKMLVKANGFTEEDIYGETKQKEFEEPKFETADRFKESVKEEISMERFKAMKTSELDQNVADHIPSNIGGISQEESKEFGIQQMVKTESVEGKIDGGESEKMPVEANRVVQKNIFGETIQKDMKKPKIETEDGDQECVRGEAGREGFEAVITVREEFPKQLPKAPLEESEGLNVSKMQETKEVKEAMVKRKGKEIECFVEKGKGEEPKRMYEEANRLIEKDITQETKQKEIEKPKNGTKDSDHENVQQNNVKGGYEVSNNKTEVFPKKVGEVLLDGSKGLKVAKMEEPKEVIKEAMAETGSCKEKVEGEESKKKVEEASRVTEKGTITETLQKESEESNIERKARDGPYLTDNIFQGEFEVLETVQEKLPKQVVEAMAQDENDKIEYGIVKLKGEGSKKMHVEANEIFEEDITRDRIEKEIREPKLRLKSSDQLSGQENVDNREFDEENSRKKFPKEVTDILFDGSKRIKFPEMGGTEDVKEEGAEIEQSVKKVKGEKYEKIQVEGNEGFRRDITRETTRKETDKDQQCLPEEISKGRFKASKASKEEFPMQIADSLANKRERPKDTKIEEAKEFKEEVVKQKSEEKMGETADVKDGAEIEQSVKKVKGEKYEEILVEANGSLRKDITRETTRKEAGEPKIQTMEKDQQCLQEEISKRRFEARKAAREFPMQILDSLTNKREGSKDKKTEEAKEVKEDVVKRNREETKVLADIESTTKEKIQESENERMYKAKQITKTLQEVPEAKQPTALELGTPERELQSTKGPTTYPKVVSMGFKEVEQGSARDKTQKKELLPQKFQSRETHESNNESVVQDILKPNKEKEVGEEEQCTYPVEEHLKKGEQVTRQDEFHRGQKVEETIKEETEEPKNKISHRDQQNVQRDVGKGVGIVETTGKEMPKEEYLADGGPIAGRMETQRDLDANLEREKYLTTQNVNDEKLRIKEEIKKIDIEKVDKVKWAAESMETTQEKEHPIKSTEVIGREAEPLEAIFSYPRVTSMGFKEGGPKSKIEKVHQKELPPLTIEKQSKEPLELENVIMESKHTKTKEHAPEPREGGKYGYGTEDIKAPKMAAYPVAKRSKVQSPTTQQSMDEEKRKSENDVQAKNEASKELPKINTKTDFQGSNEWMKPLQKEGMETLQPHILANQSLEEKQKFDGQEEALGGCEFREIIQEETKGAKIVNEDKGQQYVQEDNDKKGYETTKAVEEELLKREHREETVLEKREGPKVAKREETKEASKLLIKRERGKITQTAEDKKPKMKDITPEFEKDNELKQVSERMHETREREHQRESAKVTSKMGMEPPRMVEITPKKEIEKSQTEEMSPLPMEIQTKEPCELLRPSMEQEIPKIEGVQQAKEGERLIHTLESTTSKRDEGLAQATATLAKAKSNAESKGEIDKPQINQLPSPSKATLNKEPYELDKFSVKKDYSKAESLPQVREGKESIHSLEGTKESKEVADKVAKPSKFSSLSSTQQFEVEEKDKTDASHEVGNQEFQESKNDSKIDVQESTKSKSDQEVDQIETPQRELPIDQQCIKDQEESHGRHKIEEEKANEQGDEAHEDDSQELEEQTERKEEASGGKKDDTKRSKKLWVAPLVIAGSAILVSLIVIFVRHRRARKSTKYFSK